jgi:riboflavin kinase/FMN adenylyltransferase
MRRLRDLAALAPADRGAVAAIGNFDGVHLGHQAVIGLAREAARAAGGSPGAPLGVLTFEPHPRQWFAPEAAPFRLMSADAKAHRLQKLGVDLLVELPFDAGLAALAPEAFVRGILLDGLGLAGAVVGRDFRFGQGRAGSADTLLSLGEALGLRVTVAPMVAAGTEEVSSTAIRRALSEGRPRDAAAMLGHWHRIEGPVLHGDKRGRTLGYPTANMSLDGLHLPRFGIYAVSVDVLDGAHAGERHPGAASIGLRPQFNGAIPNCETYLLDFAGDLYGATLSVALVDYLRPEMTFDGLPGLMAQMDADVARAREILAPLVTHA